MSQEIPNDAERLGGVERMLSTRMTLGPAKQVAVENERENRLAGKACETAQRPADSAPLHPFSILRPPSPEAKQTLKGWGH